MVEKNSKHVVLTYNRKHWSLEKETLNLIQNIICPYIKDAEKKLGLYVSQKYLLLWDAFKSLSLDLVSAKLADAWRIFFLQSFDLTTNGAMKKMRNMFPPYV